MRKKTFTKGDDTYIICPHCGAIYNAKVELCPGCLNGLKLNYSPKKKKKKKKKKLTPEQRERERERLRKYNRIRRQGMKLWMLAEDLEDFEEDLGGLDKDGQMW